MNDRMSSEMKRQLPQWRIPTETDYIRILVFLAMCGLAALLSNCGGGPTQPPPPPTPTPMATPLPTPTPDPFPSPATCPPAARFGVSIHTCDAVTIGENCVMDSTGRFGANGGSPCNEEHHEVCSAPNGSWRRCEDPRGPVWSVEGPQPCTQAAIEAGDFCWQVHEENSHLLRIRNVQGRVRATACWPEDAKDSLGVPLDMTNAHCGSLAFEPVR